MLVMVIRQCWGESTGRVKQTVALSRMYGQRLGTSPWEVRSLLVLGLFIGSNQYQQPLHRRNVFKDITYP
jgi:hypothetical protein